MPLFVRFEFAAAIPPIFRRGGPSGRPGTVLTLFRTDNLCSICVHLWQARVS